MGSASTIFLVQYSSLSVLVIFDLIRQLLPLVVIFRLLRSCWKLLYSNLDSGESLLCTIFDRTSAALSQIASSVLGLWLH